MYNKNVFRKTTDKKLLRKIGKQWVTVSIATLALLGGSFAMKSATTHADVTTPAVEAQNTNNIKRALNNNLQKNQQTTKSASANSSVASSNASSATSNISSSASSSTAKPSTIQSQANNMHTNLLENTAINNQKQSTTALKPTTYYKVDASESNRLGRPILASASSSSSNQSKISTPSKVSITKPQIKSQNNTQSNSNIKRSLRSTATPNNHQLTDENNQAINEYLHFQDIYSDIDGLNGSFTQQVPQNQGILNGSPITINAPVDHQERIKWALVDRNGNVIGDNGTRNTILAENGTKTIYIAPTDKGLTYKYNRYNQSVEFTGGKADSDLSNIINIPQLGGSDNNNSDIKSIIFDDNINTSNVNDMNTMFEGDRLLQSLNLGNNFDTHNVNNMMDMFENDNSLQVIKWPKSSFITNNVSNMNAMFRNDFALQSLTLPDSFNTSIVYRMYNMFANDYSLKSLILSKSFITNQMPNEMSGIMIPSEGSMFRGDKKLTKLVIQSPETLLGFNTHIQNPPFYKELLYKDSHNNSYTLSNPNYFYMGNVGTFIRPANIPTDTIDYQYNGNTLATQQFNENGHDNSNGTGYNDLDINNTNDTNIPSNYHLVNNDNIFQYYNTIHDVPIAPNQVTDTIKYIHNGTPIGATTITGNSILARDANNTSSDVNILTANNVPSGYHLANIHNPIQFNGNTYNIPVVGDMVGGTAIINLIYQHGSHSYMNRAYVNLSSNIGDPAIVINPQNYDRDGYHIASSNNVEIPFDYPTVKAISHGDLSRYNREYTFIYKAKPTSIDIDYIDTQTHQRVPGSSVQNLSDVAYDGDTINLEDTNTSNGVLSVNGNNYKLNLPQGYHLAHTNNYIKVTANGTYTKQAPNGTGGFHMVRMPLMKLTLGITPHFHKSSADSVQPVSSASVASVTSSNAISSAISSNPSSTTSTASLSASSVISESTSNNATSSSIDFVSSVANNQSSNANSINNHSKASTVASAVISNESISVPDVEFTKVQSSKVNNDANTTNPIHISRSKIDKVIQSIPVDSKIYHKDTVIKRLSQKKHNMYIMAVKPTWIYKGTKFTKKNRIKLLKPKDLLTLPIQRIFKVNNRIVFQIRIRVNHHYDFAFITSSHKYVRNAYVQPNELKGHHYIRILRNAELHSSPKYSTKTRIGNIYRGAKLHIKHIRYISSKHMTRIQLNRGLWITANKNYVRLIK